jgi:hypothetical protein
MCASLTQLIFHRSLITHTGWHLRRYTRQTYMRSSDLLACSIRAEKLLPTYSDATRGPAIMKPLREDAVGRGTAARVDCPSHSR